MYRSIQTHPHTQQHPHTQTNRKNIKKSRNHLMIHANCASFCYYQMNSIHWDSIISWLFCVFVRVCVCACMSENCHNHEMTDRENTAAKTTHRQPSHLFERICTWYHIAFTYSVVCYVRKSISLMCVCAVEHAVWLNENITLFLAVSFSYFNVSGFVRSFPFLVAHIQLLRSVLAQTLHHSFHSVLFILF